MFPSYFIQTSEYISNFCPYYGYLPVKEADSMNCSGNKCIECTVQQCAHHCADSNYCTLDHILVGTHEMNPSMDQCTDCKSFRRK